MRWLDLALACVLPRHGLNRIQSGRVDEAFERASEARSRKVEAADETIHANSRHLARVKVDAATIRQRTAVQEEKWPNGRTSEIRSLVEGMLRSMDHDEHGKKGGRS